MPKDAKKRSRKDSDTSDSGPDDPTPVKKPSKSGGGGGGSKSSSGKPCAIPGDEKSNEPSWSLGNMKFVKVSRILLFIFKKFIIFPFLFIYHCFCD